MIGDMVNGVNAMQWRAVFPAYENAFGNVSEGARAVGKALGRRLKAV